MTDPEPVVCLRGVAKAYGPPRRTHLGVLVGGARPDPVTASWALTGVDLEVGAGECVGLIGPNGAGKTTLLRLLARVVEPSAGAVATRGRVVSMIELGVGFHPDLTGAENLGLTARLLGFSVEETAARREAIVAFAGIAEAMDTPVKRWSSGMLARLGFAIAAHAEADVLLIDEVLSVGDAEFRRRCYEHTLELAASGTAVLFVSHNLWLVEQLCGRTVRLEQGRVVDDGPTVAVVERYEQDVRRRVDAEHGPVPVRIDRVTLSSGAIAPGDALQVEVDLEVLEPGPRWTLQLRLRDRVAWDDEELDPAVDDDLVSRSIRTVVNEPIEADLPTPGRWRLVGILDRVPVAPMLAEVLVVAVDTGTGTVLDDAGALLEVMGERVRTEPLISVEWDPV